MTPQQVAELSRLLDEALALDPAQREPWLKELGRTQPVTASQLRSMLGQTHATDTELLPRLPSLESDDAIASAGERVGPYQLIREIGRGGMGSVWLAERSDGAFKRRVALKLPRLTWAEGLSRRMKREREIGALLEHPNIARLYDAGVDEHGRPYIAMEYIEGQPLDVYCRERDLDLHARLRLFGEVIQAVAYAHGRLVLHRDLKPSNVLVDAKGRAHLLDFGIAKLLDDTGASGTELTREQGRVLTLNYASPEQIAGHPLGVTADVYALGVMLYELLTGTLPYRSRRHTSAAIEEAILTGDAPAASSRVTDRRLAHELRGDVDAIIGKAIKREPSERYPTADALAADVQRYLDGRAIEARPDSAWYRLRKAAVRHRVPLLASAAVLAATLAGVTTTLMQGRRAADEAERARLATAFVSELFRVNSNELFAMNTGAPRPTQAVLLERGANLIEARFEKQPAMKAELYGVVGKVYADLGQDRLASEFATRQLQTLRAQNARSTQIARSLMLLSEVALASGRDIDAENFAQQAVDTLSKEDVALPDALALLARVQILTGKVQQAAQNATKAREALRTGVQTASSALAWLLYVEGYQLTLQNNFADALPLFKSAIVAALNAEGPTSSAAVEMQFDLAVELTGRSRSDEAQPFVEAAIATLEGQGGVHLIRAARAKVRLQAIRLERGVATPGETIALLEDVRAFLGLQSSAVPAEVLAEVDLAMGSAHQNNGEVAQAEPLIEESAQILRTSSQSLRNQFRVAAITASLKMDLGDHEAADRLLRERMEIRRKLGRGHRAAFDWVYIALNLHMQGRHQEAEAFLAKAPDFSDIQGDRRSVSQMSAIPAALSRIRLDVGDLRGARLTLPPILPERTDPNERWPPARWHWLTDPELLHAELMCATDERARGLALLTKRVKIVGDHQSPNGPELARNRSVAGLCALSLGNRKLAEEFAAQARRAFTAQPRVSPYYKEPLKRLEQQLGTKTT